MVPTARGHASLCPPYNELSLLVSLPWKTPLQSLPALEVVVLQLGRVDCMSGEPHREPAFEHERHGVGELVRLELGIAGALVRLSVGAVRRHAVVQACAARQE